MSLIKDKTTWNADSIKEEITTNEVITKPNGSQSIREILFRNTNGMAYDNYKTPFYEDQATFSSQSLNVIQDMELTEKMQFLSDLNQKTTDLKAKIEDFKKQSEAQATALAEEQANEIKNEATEGKPK